MRSSRREEGGLMEKVQEAATEVESTAAAATGPGAAPKGVTRVQVEQPPFKVGDYLWWGGAGLVSVVSEVILVLFLVYFMLVTGDLFRQKLMKIAGESAAKRKITKHILDDIDRQISRYMLVQVMTSVVVGVVSGIAFWWVGLEQPLIWGLAAGLFNTIPYFGPALVMGAIFTIGYLQFGTLWMGAYVAGLSFAITTLEGYLLLPWLTGRAIRMNGVAIFLGLMFWGWMWGAWGLLLATPMLVAIKSVCDRIDDLKPIGELLGD
jgi:predicted PurR-regulated permease PerM